MFTAVRWAPGASQVQPISTASAWPRARCCGQPVPVLDVAEAGRADHPAVRHRRERHRVPIGERDLDVPLHARLVDGDVGPAERLARPVGGRVDQRRDVGKREWFETNVGAGQNHWSHGSHRLHETPAEPPRKDQPRDRG